MTDVVDEKVTEMKVKSGADAAAGAARHLRAPASTSSRSRRSDRLGRTQVVSVDLYAGGEQAGDLDASRRRASSR